MGNESYIGLGVLLALWFVREILPFLIKAIKSGQDEVTSRELHAAKTALYRPGANGNADGTGRFTAAADPAASTGRYPAIGPLLSADEHEHLVTKVEFQAFQGSVRENFQTLNGTVSSLNRDVTTALSELTRAVGKLEGAQGARK